MLNLQDYLMGRDAKYPLPDEVVINAAKLLDKVNPLLKSFGHYRKITSGWRPKELNASVPNAAVKSKHITGDAVDLEDKDGKLKEWCVFNIQILENLGLYLEHPSATPTWCHLQQIAPKSGNRIFRP